MLILVIALLAAIALLATSMLVTTRYDQIGAQSWLIQNQIEMTFPMLEGYIRRTLTEDMWGHGSATVSGDHAIERYDARDADHPWLNGVAGKVVKWEREPGDDTDHVQGVMEDGSGWIDLPAELANGMTIRYAFLWVDCNGLLNLNTHRRNDVDFSDPALTVWAYNANANATHNGRGKSHGTNIAGAHPEWGYLWYDGNLYYQSGAYKPVSWGMDDRVLGGGPGALVNLESVLRGGDSLAKLRAALSPDMWARSFDIQTEFDLRFPSGSPEGSMHESFAEQVLPDTFGDGNVLRRYFTAVARTCNFTPRHEPQPMRPFVSGDPRFRDGGDGPADGIDDFDKNLKQGLKFNVELNDWFFENNWHYRLSLVPGVHVLPYRTEGDKDYILGRRMHKTSWTLLGHRNTYRPEVFGYGKVHIGRIPEGWGGRYIAPYTFASMMASVALLGDAHQSTPYHAATKEAMMDDYGNPARYFLLNLLDAVDPGDAHMANTRFWSRNTKTDSWRHDAMGVEIQPYISEVVLRFTAAGKLERVAIELYNPGPRSVSLSGAQWALRVHDVAYNFGNLARTATTAISVHGRNNPAALRSIPANGSLVVYSHNRTELTGLAASVRIFDINASNASASYPHASTVRTSKLTEMTAADEIRLLRSSSAGFEGGYDQYRVSEGAYHYYWRWHVMDVVRGTYGYPLGYPAAGVQDLFNAASTAQSFGGTHNGRAVTVRMVRPMGREARSSCVLPVPAAGDWADMIVNLGSANAGTSINAQTTNRSFVLTNMAAAPRVNADVARIGRHIHPREQEFLDDPDDTRGMKKTVTERIERICVNALDEIRAVGLAAELITNRRVARIWQKHEAQLTYSPWTPDLDAERLICRRRYDFIDSLSAAGAGWDGVDTNADGQPDEHRYSGYNTGRNRPPGSGETGSWLPTHFFEASNAYPIAGRLNVNTAPEVILRLLNVPAHTLPDGRSLREALADAIVDTRPHKGLEDLMYNTRTTFNGDGSVNRVGFDYFGFDGVDNHQIGGGGYQFPNNNADGFVSHGDRWSDPHRLVDDLDERNYLWRLNSEILTTRSDTFAVYLRVQLRKNQRVFAERRVFSIWDRSECKWAPKRRDGSFNADFAPPSRLGIQIFGY